MSKIQVIRIKLAEICELVAKTWFREKRFTCMYSQVFRDISNDLTLHYTYRAFSLPCRRKRSLRHERAFVNARVVRLTNHWCKKKRKGGNPHMNAALRKKNAAGNLRLHQTAMM